MIGDMLVPQLVLIPLLVDDPLWATILAAIVYVALVLIPLLVDDPLWVMSCFEERPTLSGLNPSFSG